MKTRPGKSQPVSDKISRLLVEKFKNEQIQRAPSNKTIIIKSIVIIKRESFLKKKEAFSGSSIRSPSKCGIKADWKGPSPRSLLNRLESLKAIKKAATEGWSPKVKAIERSRKKPLNLLNIVPEKKRLVYTESSLVIFLPFKKNLKRFEKLKQIIWSNRKT